MQAYGRMPIKGPGAMARSRNSNVPTTVHVANIHRPSARADKAMQTRLQAGSTRIFQTGQGSWVVAPPAGQPTKGLVHFLGGAFAGAAPQLLYSLLLDLVAEGGYTVVATPYAVTFKHDEAARAVREQFLATLKELRSSPDLVPLAPLGAPLLGLGHSMGSQLHLLIGSYYSSPTATNILMSYNNKQVSDAIPIPGFLGALGPSVQAARASPALSLPVQLPSSSQVLQQVASLLPPVLRDAMDDGGRLTRAALALDQVASVFGEVGDGVTDFVPSPSECRKLIGGSYSVGRTLLVRFQDDSIDETPEIEMLLRPRFAGQGMQTLNLPGTHVTPCGGDLELPAANSPTDLVVQLVKEQAQVDVRRLGSRVVGWMDNAVVSLLADEAAHSADVLHAIEAEQPIQTV